MGTPKKVPIILGNPRIGIMENNMETTGFREKHWGSMGTVEKKKETSIMGNIGIIGCILGLYRDSGKGDGNCYIL